MRSVGWETANLETFDGANAVSFYARGTDLQPAERSIFTAYREKLADASLLDVGVGGGRTTLHLASRVRAYVGVDCSPQMVAAARRRFPDVTFLEADARRLPADDGALDVVLFSYNGIDYVDDDARAEMLEEMKRVLAPGGLFIFSTHNLLRGDMELSSPSLNPFSLLRALRLRRANPDWKTWSESDFALIVDGAFDYRVTTYHVRPSVQLADLEANGFGNVRVFCGRNGTECALRDADTMRSAWFYVVCEKL